MSIDERLRGLYVDTDEPTLDVVLLDQIADRAHARRRRRRTVSIVASMSALAVVAAAPIWWQRSDSNGQPVHPPSQTIPTFTTVSTPTENPLGGQLHIDPPQPVEAPGWSSAAANQREWLRTFVGQPGAAQALKVYQRAKIDGLPITLELAHGLASVRIGHLGNRIAAPLLTLSGHYKATQRSLELRLDGVGTSRYRWRVATSGINNSVHRLTLTHLSSTGPPQFGAPPEILLRLLLTASSFTYHEGP